MIVAASKGSWIVNNENNTVSGVPDGLRVAVLAGALLLSGWAAGQPAVLGLGDVVQRVLQGNPQLEIGRQKVLGAEARQEQAQGRFDWGVYANAGMQRRYVPVSRGDLLTTHSTLDNLWVTEMGVRRQFRNGVSIGPGVALYQSDNDAAEAAFQAVSRPMINLNIPLMRGAGEAVVTADSSAAAELVQAVRAETRQAAARLLTDAVIAYWDAVAATEQLAALKSAAAPAARFVASLQNLAEHGESAPAVYEQARADLLLRRLEIDQAETESERVRRRLALTLGDDTSELPQVGGHLIRIDDHQDSLPADAASIVQLALKRRMDLDALKQRLGAEEIRLVAARDRLQPKVDLSVDLDQVMLRYEQTLERHGANGDVRQRQAALQELRLQLRQRERQIRSEVLDALGRLRSARRDAGRAATSVDLYQSLVKEARRKVRLGEAANSEYTLLQDRLARSRNKEIAAHREYAIALASLRLATGTTGVEQDAAPAQIAGRFSAWTSDDQ